MRSQTLKQVRPHIGYIPVAFEGYPELSVVDYLNFFAAAYKLDKQERVAAIDTVLELMDVQHLRDTLIGVLSSGERQRLLFAKTFLHEPMLWILDEPLTPLGPRGQIEMVELLRELQSMGKHLSSQPIAWRMCINFVGVVLRYCQKRIFSAFSKMENSLY